MSGNYLNMRFGKYHGKPINEVPLEYLVWVFGKIRLKNVYRFIYKDILRYFIEKGVEVEDRTKTANGYCFTLKDYNVITPKGNKVCFFQSFWRGVNSKGNYVYEVGNEKYPIFLEENKNGFKISNDYVSYNYKFRGRTMIYEKNPDYYFYDGLGKTYYGAYLMRMPYIPHGCLEKDFSENLLIKNIVKNES